MKLEYIIRRTAERLSRGKIIKRHIFVGGRKVSLFVSPDAQLKYFKFWRNAFDADLVWLAENFLEEDSNVWDIGANVGVFTFASSAVAHKGTILSVEADIWLADILRRSAMLKENRNADIRILPAAISDNNSLASFLIAMRGRACNALEEAGGRSKMGGVRERQYVPTLTLDTISSSVPKPDFIKIDVESAELMVLRGAINVISSMRPVFYIEVSDNVADEVMRLFHENKYLAFDIQTGAEINQCMSNYLFIPEEKKKAQQQLASDHGVYKCRRLR